MHCKLNVAPLLKLAVSQYEVDGQGKRLAASRESARCAAPIQQ
jgi:hypothetical protein